MNNAIEKMADLKHKIFLEMTAYWINILYFTLVFAAFTSYRRLIPAHYYISYENWGVSLIKALVLAKVIMIGGYSTLPAGSRTGL
jgi:hypothetical protein